jgi:hypothetical protein
VVSLTINSCNINSTADFTFLHITKEPDSSVGIATGYGLDDRGSRVLFPAGAGNFSLLCVQTGSGAQPPSYLVGASVSFPNGKAAVAWSWPLTEVEMRGAIFTHTPPPPYVFMAWGLVKHRDNFAFTPFILQNISTKVSKTVQFWWYNYSVVTYSLAFYKIVLLFSALGPTVHTSYWNKMLEIGLWAILTRPISKINVYLGCSFVIVGISVDRDTLIDLVFDLNTW